MHEFIRGFSGYNGQATFLFTLGSVLKDVAVMCCVALIISLLGLCVWLAIDYIVKRLENSKY